MPARQGRPPRLESLLPARTIEKEIHRVAVQYLQRSIVVPAGESARIQAKATLVIHLRSGDIQDLSHDLYIVNPLYYYRRLSSFHDRAIIVTEPGAPHPLLPDIQDLFPDCKVISGSVRDDFEILRQAHFLASSGVGTFAIAAALLSPCLERFYCTNLFMDEHLNPRMLNRSRIDVIEVNLLGYREKWSRHADRHMLIRNYNPR